MKSFKFIINRLAHSIEWNTKLFFAIAVIYWPQFCICTNEIVKNVKIEESGVKLEQNRYS